MMIEQLKTKRTILRKQLHRALLDDGKIKKKIAYLSVRLDKVNQELDKRGVR